MAGDSTAIGVGDRLKVAASDNPELEIDQQGKVATGLSRSDYFNWGARMQELTTELSPDVVLFMIGANDAQAVLDPDGSVVADYGTPAWSDAYRQRIGGIMDLAHDGGRSAHVGRRARTSATPRCSRPCRRSTTWRRKRPPSVRGCRTSTWPQSWGDPMVSSAST